TSVVPARPSTGPRAARTATTTPRRPPGGPPPACGRSARRSSSRRRGALRVEAVEVAGLLMLVLSVSLLGLVVRRRVLDRAGGTVEMSLRLGRHGELPHGSMHWSFGVGRYDGDRLVWFKTFSASPRPRLFIDRATLTVSGR